MVSLSLRFNVFLLNSLSVSYPHAAFFNTIQAPVAHLDFLRWHTVNSSGAGACVISTGIKSEYVICQP